MQFKEQEKKKKKTRENFAQTEYSAGIKPSSHCTFVCLARNLNSLPEAREEDCRK